MSLVVSKIQRTSIAIWGPHELRERVGEVKNIYNVR